ncbi:MAG TPA: PD-(D/E)XK nuclease family protein [Candidatus Saccharimonadales bacterium]|nr:PD-(D/E)XK nuclease family protein [Candidatus Saccharimonadales bacterium]
MTKTPVYSRHRSQPYKPGQSETFKLSRSKIDLFLNCPACFWLDRRLKISRPEGFPFQINKAVDELLKKEFDTYRLKRKPHPYMVEYKIDAIPYQHENLNTWRENFVGIQYLHEPTNLLIFGAVDDVWVNPAGELIVVDYKATSKRTEVTLDAPWQIGYKRQMEVYQWLLKRNGFEVSDTGYFVYCNGRLDPEGFFNKIEFNTKVIDYTGNSDWVEPTLEKIKKALESKAMPQRSPECEYCSYAESRVKLFEQNRVKQQS